MNSDEIRTAYLKFFEEKGHKIIPSSSLVPQGDPTLLLTTAGMVQIKPYFMGEEEPPSRRLTSCQKCFRTTDIESVGDATHLTFFEMLGNFSVGDYFKQEAIAWAWEFVTRRLKLPPEKLWITIFLDDEEAFKYWREIGIPKEKIVRCGEKDNFWGPAGKTGPCGPCSEIHYDFGVEAGCGQADCRPNHGCSRFCEIWNLVFTQYNQDAEGKRTPLPRPNIDTGMGLERVAAAIGDKRSVYDTDIFAPLREAVARLTVKKYGADAEADNAMRVVAEHGRALAFLIADGVMPDNEGRGYVLRRLLRRAALFGRRLGLDKPFLSRIARAAIKKMGGIYPELVQRRDFIIKVIEQEEARFEETLSTGLEIIEDVMSRAGRQKNKVISGADAFRLYDTYGFPVELTREVVAKAGFSVAMEGFEKEMAKQRERARASHKFDGTGALVGASKLEVAATAFVGYEKLEQKAKLIKILVAGKETSKISDGQEAGIILDATPFYGEMGGQVGDTGELRGPNGRFTVSSTVHLTPEVILHQGKATSGSLSAGEAVEAIVDMQRRLDIARNHTATHLLQAALRQVLGDHVQQRGSLVAPERLRFDFSHLAAVTPAELKAVQRIVNEKVREDLTVGGEEKSYKEAVAAGATALFGEKYGDTVRVMKIGEPAVSLELCGGTHIRRTGEIGYFQIIGESSIGAGLRRIEAVTGRGAEEFIGQRLAGLEEVARSLEAAPEEAQKKVDSLLGELEKEKKHALTLERKLARIEAKPLLDKKKEVKKDIWMLAERVSVEDTQMLRETADILRDELGSGIIVLGAVIDDRPIFTATASADMVAMGYNAGDIVRRVSKVTGGGGGGKANFAQAGGRDVNKMDEALSLVEDLIKGGGG